MVSPHTGQCSQPIPVSTSSPQAYAQMWGHQEGPTLPEHHSHPSGLPLCQAAGELTAGVSPQALGEQLSVQGRWWPAPQAAGSRASIMGPLGQALLVILGPE